MPRYSRHSPEFHRSNQPDKRRQYEAGGVFPQPADRSELLERFRLRFEAMRAGEQHALDDRPNVPAPFTDIELGFEPAEGEQELPVRLFKEPILDSVARHQVTIVTAETGAGKSTQIPQYLLERGYTVSMTQPRRLAAQLVAERIGEEVEAKLGDQMKYARELVGYHTAERNTVIDGHTRVEVVTDGLRLVQEFGEREQLEGEVLIIDEVHEWNSNIEMLIARTKQLVKEKPDLRVVIMSATMEAEKLSAYFSSVTGDKPPILNVPGRNHEVQRLSEPNSDVVEQAVKYAREGENILIFLPGVREINDKMHEVGKRLADLKITDAVLLPLHSKMSQKDQDAVKSFYPGPKIIFATNIAQTSITIPDVNVVIDSGLERRTEIDEQGIQGLHLRPASRADMNQRAGRTGRVAPGVYVHTQMDAHSEHPFIPFDDKKRRLDYPVPEILRTNTHSNTLLAASAGIDMKKFDLFHPVDKGVIDKAKEALISLGALDQDGLITPRGERMVRLPMRPEYARMIIEAEDFPASVRQQVVAMTSVMEEGGLVSWLDTAPSRDWRELSEETDSDFIAQLDVFIKIRDKTPAEIEQLGLDVRNVERARERYEKIVGRLRLPRDDEALALPTAEERKLLTQAITAGLINNIYVHNGEKAYSAIDKDRDPYQRNLSGRTTINSPPHLLVGTPYRIERSYKRTTTNEHVIQDATATTTEALGAVAIRGHQDQVEWQNIDLRLSEGNVRRVQRQLFRQAIILDKVREVDAEFSPETAQFIVNHMLEKSGPALRRLKALKTESERWQHLTQEPLTVLRQQDLEYLIVGAIDQSKLNVDYVDWRLSEAMRDANLSIDSLIPKETRERILAQSPREIEYEGKTYRLDYRNGIPRMKVESVDEVMEWTAAPRLKDGREVKLLYESKALYLKDFRKYVRQGKLFS